jgi:hypothetical protein
MRKSTVLLAIGLASHALAMSTPAAEPPTILTASGQAPSGEALRYKRLDDQEALENLQHSNPRHYAIARRILAAANEICDASEGAPIPTKFDAMYVNCAHSFWLTSNPPRRALQFRIDDTVYSVLVIVRDTHARLEPIH